MVAETGVTAGRDVTVSFKAEPTHAYIIVPHTGWVREVVRCVRV